MLAPGVLILTALSVLVTSFISGIFGMAGGMMLMGLLLAMMPVSVAMVVHGAAQLTANGWRALLWRRHIDLRIFGRFLTGLVAAGGLFSFVGFMPDRVLVLLTLGSLPFVIVLIPQRYVIQATHRGGAEICGFVNAAMQFIAGVSGPLLDIFFIRTEMDRRSIVATKAACQATAHLAKLIYFGHALGSDTVPPLLVVVAVAMGILGTTLGKSILERMSDHQFRRWTRGLVMAIGTVYLIQGVYLWLAA